MPHRDLALKEQANKLLEPREPMTVQPSPTISDRDEGLLAGPRRLTNRAFDALDEMGDWVLGRQY
jgi:hypothetical protein